MPKRTPAAVTKTMRRTGGTRVCYIRPALLGPLKRIAPLLDRCARLGFDTVVLPCPFVADNNWAQARLADAERLASVFAWNGSACEGLGKLAALVREHGLAVLLCLRLDDVAGDAPVVAEQH